MIGLLIKSTILWDLFSLFPACAGVIPISLKHTLMKLTFPRIRGGDPELGKITTDENGFSPHTWG